MGVLLTSPLVLCRGQATVPKSIGMRILVIYCHPVPESFVAAAHQTVLEALAAAGHQVTDVDLYAEHFDPVMSRQERLDYLNTQRNERRVRHYDDQLVGAEGLVLIYPAWWYGMPAMLKGYFDRVWLPGVAFDVQPDGKVSTERLKSLRRIIVVTTYGGSRWLVRFVIGDPARKLIGRAIRALCARDCKVTWFVHYSMDSAKPRQLARFLARIRKGVAHI
jgi:NAD(P)H dehydrogenase (quinone)